MDKKNSNINLGLTQEELELLVKNSNNPAMLKKFEYKLDNCDLSKSAIELIDKDNLAAAIRITESISANYPSSVGSRYSKYIIGGVISVGIIIVITTYLMSSEKA